MLVFNLPKDLTLSCPLIGSALNAIGPLVVKTLVIRLENATMPETKISLHPRIHLFLILPPIVHIKLQLKLLIDIRRHHKQPLIIIHLLFLHIHHSWHETFFTLRTQVAKDLKRSRTDVPVDYFYYFLN